MVTVQISCLLFSALLVLVFAWSPSNFRLVCKGLSISDAIFQEGGVHIIVAMLVFGNRVGEKSTSTVMSHLW